MARRNLEKILKDNAKYWAQRYTTLARNLAPKHIAPHITTSSSISNSSIVLQATVKPVDSRGAEGQISNYGTLDAAAQEYGHPGAVIKPRVKKILAFHWDVVPTFKVKRDKEGRVLLGINYKTGAPHPLIKKPQKAFNNDMGYLRPAMDEWSDELKNSSSKFKDAIKLDILDAFNKVTRINLSK